MDLRRRLFPSNENEAKSPPSNPMSFGTDGDFVWTVDQNGKRRLVPKDSEADYFEDPNDVGFYEEYARVIKEKDAAHAKKWGRKPDF